MRACARTAAVAFLVGCLLASYSCGRPILQEHQQQQQPLQISFAELRPTVQSIWVPSISTSAKKLQVPVTGLPGTPLPLDSMSRLVYTVTYKRKPAYVLKGTVNIAPTAAFSSTDQQQIQQPLVTLKQSTQAATVPDPKVRCSSLMVSQSSTVSCSFAVTIFALDAPPPAGTAQALVQIPGTGTHVQTPPMTYDFSSLAPVTSHMRLGSKDQMSDLLFNSVEKPPATTALVTNYFEQGQDVILPTGVAGAQPPPQSFLTDTKTYTYTALFGDVPRDKCGKKWKVLASASIESTSDGLQPPETATSDVDLDLLGCGYQAPAAAPVLHGCDETGPSAAAAAAKKQSSKTPAARHSNQSPGIAATATAGAAGAHNGNHAAAAAAGNKHWTLPGHTKHIQIKKPIVRSLGRSGSIRNINIGYKPMVNLNPPTPLKPQKPTDLDHTPLGGSAAAAAAVRRQSAAKAHHPGIKPVSKQEPVAAVAGHSQQQHHWEAAAVLEKGPGVAAATTKGNAASTAHATNASYAAEQTAGHAGHLEQAYPAAPPAAAAVKDAAGKQPLAQQQKQQQQKNKVPGKASKLEAGPTKHGVKRSESSSSSSSRRSNSIKEDGTPAMVTTAALPPNVFMAAQGSTLCGRYVCTPGQVCMDDIVCCDPGAGTCGGSCCPRGNVCMNGRCMPPGSTTCGATACSPMQMCLSGKCCDANVPTCGNTCCDANQMCVNGQCVASGSSACGTKVCGPDQQCITPGICCNAGETQCGSACCGAGNTCLNGQCVAGGSSLCAGLICGPGSVCTGGAMCCPVGSSFCSGSCCGGGNQCVSGRCLAFGSTPCGGNVCNADQTCQNGVCCNRGESGCGAGCCATSAGMQCIRNQCLPAGTQPCGTTTCPPGTFCGDPYRSICCGQGTRACAGACCPADQVCSWRQTCVPWNAVEAGQRQGGQVDYISHIHNPSSGYGYGYNGYDNGYNNGYNGYSHR